MLRQSLPLPTTHLLTCISRSFSLLKVTPIAPTRPAPSPDSCMCSRLGQSVSYPIQLWYTSVLEPSVIASHHDTLIYLVYKEKHAFYAFGRNNILEPRVELSFRDYPLSRFVVVLYFNVLFLKVFFPLIWSLPCIFTRVLFIFSLVDNWFCLPVFVCIPFTNAVFALGGIWATIRGSSLQGVSLVLFGSQSCAISVTTSSSHRIECKVPSRVSGSFWYLPV